MKTINIKTKQGVKQYATVNERVKYFRTCEEYKGWRIHTEKKEFTPDYVMFRTLIFDPHGNVISTGHAFEMRADGLINATSFVENCETSAVGRALAFLGIGIDGGIASLDEILSAGQYEYITKLLQTASVSEEDAAKINDKLTTMTTEDAEAVIRFLQGHQIDPIEGGFGYNQGNINRRLDKIDKDPKK